jgi:glyoxylase-like metal-dependent hydrolase (beta-lactamase superfamily II)
LTLLGRPWTVYHTPGHAGDLICFYEPQSRVLLSSDHLLRDISSNALMEPPQPGQKRPRRLLEYMAQLERIAALDIQTAYGGHGEPATHVLDLVAQRLVFHRQRADYILALMGDEALTLFQVTQRMFAHVPEAQQFLALSEVLGHLDWLERDGALRRTMVDDLTLWQRA